MRRAVERGQLHVDGLQPRNRLSGFAGARHEVAVEAVFGAEPHRLGDAQHQSQVHRPRLGRLECRDRAARYRQQLLQLAARRRRQYLARACGRRRRRTPAGTWRSCPARSSPPDRSRTATIRHRRMRHRRRSTTDSRPASACGTNPAGTSVVRIGHLPQQRHRRGLRRGNGAACGRLRGCRMGEEQSPAMAADDNRGFNRRMEVLRGCLSGQCAAWRKPSRPPRSRDRAGFPAAAAGRSRTR